ncbi:hypothetical protein BDD12DRAFT_163397 [Trichophaea hybrida]|nr:hypothetical protein BDD12DRAFT_163397 [Trichophaea hybrida]
MLTSRTLFRSPAGERRSLSFSQSTLLLTRRLHTPLEELRINTARFLASVHEVSRLGSQPSYSAFPPAIGTSLAPPSSTLRTYLSRTLNIPPQIDELGNIFLTLPSQRPSLPSISLGGALDSPSPLPILSALEVLRTLQESPTKTSHPITFSGWSCSSGSRFPRALLGSAAWAGEVGVEEAWALREAGGEKEGRRSVKACLREAGWLGEVECSVRHGIKLGSYFEIVPSPLVPLGLATGADAWRWVSVSLRGGDALIAGARMIIAAREIAGRHGGKATAGVFDVESAGFSGTSKEVRFALHIRHPRYTGVLDIEGACTALFETIAREEGGKVVGVELVMDEPEVAFEGSAMEVVRGALDDMGEVKEGVVDRPVDAVAPSKRGVTTGVVLVQEGGAVEEWAKGAQVLLTAIVDWDRQQSAVGQVTQHGFLSM